MIFSIRPYHASDLCALYRICLLTGDGGSDATSLYQDGELLGHYYVAPYVVFEPEVCFTLTQDGVPCGYVLGARESTAFGMRCEQDWFPTLRKRYPLPPAEDASADAGIIRAIHHGYQPHPDAAAFPAHLHIDLLPIAQGQGWGRKLMETFLDRLRAFSVPAVHLGVSASNTRAIAFYERVGFHLIQAYPGWSAYGMHII